MKFDIINLNARCSGQKLTLSKMLTRVQVTKFLFGSFHNNQLPPSHRLSREHPQFPKSLHAEPKSTSKALIPKAIPEQAPYPRGIAPRSHLQSNISGFTQKSSVTAANISACNHAASPPHIEDM